ncbi:MAG: hypothetical protein ACTSV1_04680, partial [Alphaproteobacteria bacterium]
MQQGSGNNKAVVTLAVGDDHLAEFMGFAKATWEPYCQRHGYDLIVLTEPIDGQADLDRTPIHWQKLLVGQMPGAERYDHMVWVDTDIVINHHLAPCIAGQLTGDRIGAIDASDEVHTRDEFGNLKTRYTALNTMFVAKSTGVPDDAKIAITRAGIEDLYGYFGFDIETPHFINTGVFVFNPARHNDFLLHIYNNSSDQRYMDTVFSYELIGNDMVEFVDRRFNMLWPIECARSYPFLFDPEFMVDNPETVRMCVNTAFRNSYFLH